jgi:O-antigen/teichoic acid export membrane protein
MSRIRTYARNITANWLGFGAVLVVSFFLTPFIVHRLGDEAYGVWSLLLSVTGYLGLLEIGVMNSTGRYINYYLARNEDEMVSNVVNTSLSFYLGITLLLLAFACILQPFFGQIFSKIPHDLSNDAGTILVLLSANVGLGFLSATLRQLLISQDRFDLQNAADIVVLILRASGVVYVLIHGYGLLSLALVHIGSAFVGCIMLFSLVKSYGPRIAFGTRFITKRTYRELAGFGIFAFFGDIGTHVIYYTDAIVIGILIGAEEITLYSIGFFLVDYGRKLAIQAARVMMPDILKCAGAEKFSELRWLVIRGTRMVMLVTVPLFLGLLILGKEFIALWMGPTYERSWIILVILAIPQFMALASRHFGTMLLGLGRVKLWAGITLIEAVFNLFLSIFFVLVLNLNIEGVALGTLIPMVLCTGLILPVVACRSVKMSFIFFLKNTFFRWFAAIVLYAIVLIVIARVPTSLSWSSFWLKGMVACLFYRPTGVLVLLSTEDRTSHMTVLISLEVAGRAACLFDNRG